MSNTPIVDAQFRKNIDQWHGAKLSALKQAEQIKTTAQFTFELGLLAQQLERKLRIAELKNKGTLANNLCPDHRDKQAGKPCLACTIETLERHAMALATACQRRLAEDGIDAEELSDWRAFCKEMLG